MTPGDMIRERVDLLSGADCVYTRRVTEMLNVEIKPENLDDLESLIDLYEMHEEAVKEVRRALMLKQHACLLGYLAEYARNLDPAA